MRSNYWSHRSGKHTHGPRPSLAGAESAHYARRTEGRLIRICALAALLTVGVGFGASIATPNSSSNALPPIKHVFVIVLENESEATTFGAGSAAPYLANTLVSQGAFLPDYYGIGHHSLDNYIAMISGQAPDPETQNDCQTYDRFTVTGTTASDGQAVGDGCIYPSSVPTVAGQLTGAGLTWRGYMDSMGADPSREAATCGHPPVGGADATQLETASDQYATRHDPFMYFDSIIGDEAYCDSHVVPLTNLAGDLARYATTPNFSFITPSLCNDGHDSPCDNGQPGGLTQANTFLSSIVPEIEASPAYQRDGLIVITFDEADAADASSCCGEQSGANVSEPGLTGPGGGKVGAVLLSPFIKPGTVSETPYNHYSLLLSIEDIFGLPALGYAATPGLSAFGSDIFTAAATSTSTGATPTATTTTTTSPTKPTCRSLGDGPVIGPVTLASIHSVRRVEFRVLRTGSLGYRVEPSRGRAGPLEHRQLRACQQVSLILPAGDGTIRLMASSGATHQGLSHRY